MNQPVEDEGCACLVREVGLPVVVVVLSVDPPRLRKLPSSLTGILEEWGRTLMWQFLKLTRYYSWLEDSI